MRTCRGSRPVGLALALVLAACAAPVRVAGTGNSEASWRASRDVFHEANGLLYDALLELGPTSLDAAVWGENKLPPEVRRELATRGEKGAAWALEAADLDPDCLEAQLYLALNLSITALGKGKAQAFVEGLPVRIRAAYERVIDRDPAFLGAGAVRLKGKFLMLVPWPFRDRAEAERALLEAARLADVPQCQLFLGDLYHLEGRPEEASAAWHRVLALPPHPTTSFLDDRIKALARLRLAFLEG